MKNLEIQRRVLHELYEVQFLNKPERSLRKVCEEGEWNDVLFWNAVDEMKDEGLIRPTTIGGFFGITSQEILYAEKQQIAPKETTRENSEVRSKILEILAVLREERGSFARLHVQEIGQRTDVDDEMFLSNNLRVLKDLGFIETQGGGAYKITHQGLDTVDEWRRRNRILTEFETVSGMEPRQRGRAFQKLFARIVEQNGWHQQEGVRTSHEEMDVIVFQEREYYLVECKWEKDPIQARVIRELYGKLGNRIGVRGMLVSMSGFTDGALKQTNDFASQRVILLFGPKDVESLINGQLTFNELLDQKYHALIAQGESIFE